MTVYLRVAFHHATTSPFTCSVTIDKETRGPFRAPIGFAYLKAIERVLVGQVPAESPQGDVEIYFDDVRISRS
jgi:hypothetical protein